MKILDYIQEGKIFKHEHVSTKLIDNHYYIAYDYATPIYKKDINNYDEVFDNRWYSRTTTIFQNTLNDGFSCLPQKRKDRSIQYRKGGETVWKIQN
jgi:hypothetical protein